MTTDWIVDGCGGPGGWDTGIRDYLATNQRTIGIEWDPAACRTRSAAGHVTIRASVADYWPGIFAGKTTGMIFSPPCQAWSKAGKRLGLKDQAAIFDHLHRVDQAGAWIDYPREGWHDERSPLVLEPLRWAMAIHPEWIALEQVEDVLPFWQALAAVLRRLGYSTWCGVLSAEMFGVPQTRRRAFLIASRVRTVSAPVPTHQRYVPPAAIADEPDGLFAAPERQRIVLPTDRHLLPWVSMAEALGWGHESASYRRTRGAGMLERHGDRPTRPVSEPAPTITGKVRSDTWVMRNGPQPNATARTEDEPAGTAYCSRPGNLRWALMAAGATGQGTPRTDGAPSPTITGAGNAVWVHDRPATTVCGDARVGRPGHKDREGGEAQFENDSVRVTVEEAGVLQSFPADYPWQGSQSARYRQVGDAVPPLLAAHVVHAASGIPWATARTEAGAA